MKIFSVRSLSDLEKLLVDTMCDYTKIILPNIYVPSYLNLYVTLQNACELTKFLRWLRIGKVEECLSFYKFQKVWDLMGSKDKTLGGVGVVWSVITQYTKGISFREMVLEYHQNAS